MKKLFLLLIALAACIPSPAPPVVDASVELVVPPMEAAPRPSFSADVHFSPSGGCTDAVVAFIGSARKSVRVQAYSFTSAPIAKALVDARRRGLVVEVLLDRSDRTANGSMLHELVAGDVAALIDAKHAIAHNKVTIVDGVAVETGSFNYTAAAEHSNAENCLVLDLPELAARYEANWRAHLAHSEAP